MNIKYGAELKLAIATGHSRKETKWKNQNMTWGELVTRLAETTRTPETAAEYSKMPKDRQDALKDVGGFVAGQLKDGRRKNGYVLSRSVVTLDVDYGTPGLWDQIRMLFDFSIAAYSTHKHSEEKPRFRLVIPLTRAVSPEEYEAVARRIAGDIGIDYFDDTTYEPARLMYWPSTSRDAPYLFGVNDRPVLDPDAVLKTYADWKDASLWPTSTREPTAKINAAKTQEDPLTKKGLIGAFCRTYGIEEAIARWLPGVYSQCDIPGRFTFTGGSTSAGLVVYDNKFAYSNHSTDPASGILCNAFDLVRIHLFGDLDTATAEDTPINKRPSWKKMMDTVGLDENVRQTLGREELQSAREDFGEPDDVPESKTPADAEATETKKPAKEDMKWLSKLTRNNAAGHIDTTIENMATIMENDPRLKGIVGLNEFSGRNEILRKLPWPHSGGEGWNDTDDAFLRGYFEKIYKLDHRQKLIDAMAHATEAHAFNPVREYIESTTWDKKKRLETLFIEFLGADDNDYVRTVTRKTLVAAVARIMHPGIKFDYMTTLVGPQGIGKSLLVQKLAHGWGSDTLTDIKGKEAYEALDGVWILEMGELAALRKAERELIKSFISKTEDTYRKAFARNTTTSKRKCIFIGTTNSAVFLDDPTGARRFLVIDTCEAKRTKTPWGDLSEEYVAQVWAEALEYFKKGENIMEMPEAVARAASAEQSGHSELSGLTGLIGEYLEKVIPDDWASKNIQERRSFMMATDDFQAEARGKTKGNLRTRVCPMEIWCECFGKTESDMKKSDSRDISESMLAIPGWTKQKNASRYGPYGTQRGWERTPGGK